MGITSGSKLPYPEPTDPVRDGATAIKNLALATEKAIPALGMVTPAGQIGRAYAAGDKILLATFWGQYTSNQFGQVAMVLPAGFAGIGSISAIPAATSGQGQAYFIVDNVNSSLTAAVMYIYAQNGNALLPNFPISFSGLVIGWGAIT